MVTSCPQEIMIWQNKSGNIKIWKSASSAGSYLADPTSPIPSHSAVIIQSLSSASTVVTS